MKNMLTWCSARNSRMSTTCHAGEKTPAKVRPSPARIKMILNASSPFCTGVLPIWIRCNRHIFDDIFLTEANFFTK